MAELVVGSNERSGGEGGLRASGLLPAASLTLVCPACFHCGPSFTCAHQTWAENRRPNCTPRAAAKF